MSEFAGKWRVVEALDLVDDYLSISPDPHILLEVKSKSKKDVLGSYQFGVQDGVIDGHFEKDQMGNMRLVFTFDGCDEMDRDSGYGTASFEAPGVLLLVIHHHMGDTLNYRCRRDQD
ncbi:MAG: hypothetical protein WB392_04575 [Methanotrichaceae archaeon]